MKRFGLTLNRAVLIAVAAILFVAVNVLSTTLLKSARVDLTADRLYTLSDGTRRILAGIEEPITLRLFFSDAAATPYPSIKSYGQRVRSLLQEYEALADGGIRLEIIDPEPFSTAEDDAVAAGLQGIRTNGGDTIYFGLVGTNATDLQLTIPFFSPDRERFLEYDLTKLVSDLSVTEKPVLGLVSWLPLAFGPGGPMAAAQGQSAPYVIYEQLRESYSIRQIGQVFSKIDPDVDLLLVVHPGDLGEQELYAIDQFVLRGGKLILFVDPFLETAPTIQSMPGTTLAATSNLEKLLKAWGVDFDPTKVVADRSFAQRVSIMGPQGRETKDYVAWLGLHGPGLSADDPVTAELDMVNLASPGALQPIEGATTRFEPVLRSSAESMYLPVSELRFQPRPDDLLRQFKADGQEKTLAARITGPAKSAFDGPVENGEGEGDDKAEKPAPHVTEGQINVLVVADADILEDQYWVQVQQLFGQRIALPLADNGPFVMNAVDNMSGSSDLISLRSRGVSQRPFTLVADIQRKAEARFLAEEKRLQAKLAEAERRIQELEEGRGEGDMAALNRSQAEEIENFRREMLATRKQLRDVQHNLRRDIERLGVWVKAANLALMPILVAIAALVIASVRQRRRRAAVSR